MNKIVVIILFIVSIIGLFLVYDSIQKEESQIVKCFIIKEDGKFKKTELLKDSILCSENSDCSVEKMDESCSPGFRLPLLCIGVKYYCSNDKKCREYSCL
ncbi:MAG: hypothetical protein KAI67_01350 [Candidatus Pacebacteria bacterium]|nr:hypothetical protein [Candidatus Paceibacterota bacterium]